MSKQHFPSRIWISVSRCRTKGRETQIHATLLTMNQSLYCYNSFLWRQQLSRTQTNVIAACLILIIPVILTANGALVFALYKTDQTKTMPNKLALLLSISDVMLGLICIPTQVFLFAKFPTTRVCLYELTSIFITQLNAHFSMYIVMIIALQRYFKVNPSLRSRTSWVTEALHSSSGIAVLVTTAFVLSIGHGLVTTYFFNTTKSKIPNYVLMCMNMTALITVYGMYVTLFLRVRIHTRNSRQLHEVNGRQATADGNPGNITYFKDFTKTIAIILIIFAICFMPYLIMDFVTGWYSFAKKTASPQMIRFMYYISFTPGYFFSAINATILLYRNKKATVYIKQRLTSMITPLTQAQ